MKSLPTQPVKGFRDLYPDEMVLRQWLFRKMRETAHLFGYQEYDGPILEPLELYAAKSGEELVKQQTFRLTDRGERELAMRPELTPSLARMVAAKQHELIYPLRWFSIGPRFRYEAPQRGRGREFYQFDCDLIGPRSPEADAEIIALAASFLQNLLLTPDEVVIKVNSRQMMQHKLSLIDISPKQVPDIIRAIDKKDKMEEQDWVAYLKQIKLKSEQIKNLQQMLTDRDVSYESDELTQVFSTLSDLGMREFVEYDPSIVRGLEYYTGTVFEARDRKGKFRALLGGGRYDNLVELFGGEPLSGIGFAVGDMVLMEVLRTYNLIPSKKLSANSTRVLVTIFDESLTRSSIKLARAFREMGIPTELYPYATTKLDKQIRYADRKNIPFVAVLGPDEVARNVVTLKDLSSGQQEQTPINEALKKLLTNS
jgi:histidyl-tRNA synthetase